VSNIVDLQAKLQAKRQGEGDVTFMLCPCTPDGTPPLPVVLHDAHGPLLIALMCPECENEIGVINGRLQIE
jgi:hypothetical protein